MKMNKRVIFIILLALTSFTVFNFVVKYDNKAFKVYAKEGILDLRSESIIDRKMLLAGEWTVYDKLLLSPGDLETIEKKYLMEDRNSIESRDPHRTYALKILFNSPMEIDLLISEIKAFKLWVNEEETLNYRFPSEVTQNQRMNTIRLTKDSYIRTEDGYEINLVLQVINRISHRERPWRILLGNIDTLNQVENTNLIINTFAVGVYFLIVIYSFSLYFKKRSEEYLLYIGLIGLNNTMHSILDSNIPIIMDSIQINPDLWNKLIDLTVVINLILIYVFCIKLFYAEKLSKKQRLFVIVLIPRIVITILITIIPVQNMNLGLKMARVLAPLNLIIVLIAYLRGKTNNLILIGGFCFAITAFFEGLINTGILPVGIISVYLNTSQYGYLIFSLLVVLTVATKYSSRFNEADLLAIELEYMNKNLEDLVFEKTNELQISYDHIMDLQNKKQKFLMNISHDLRSPLFIIKGYMDAILDGLVKDEESMSMYLRRMKEKTEYLSRLIEELFLISKLEDNLITLNKERFDFKEFLMEICEAFLHKGNISIEYNIETCDYSIVGDKFRIQQVIENILDNAYKHIRGEGLIEVSLEAIDDNSILLEVKDNGNGISKGDLPDIFERLYKGHEDLINNESTGLGLAISKELVEKHNGRIYAESEVGVGTSIFISLPRGFKVSD